MNEDQCAAGQCQGRAIRCGKHGAIWAKETMEKQGWVCINEYGLDVAVAVDNTFIRTLEAVQLAGVEMQRWVTGWDHKRGSPMFGVWAPKAVAAILGAVAGKLDAKSLAVAFKKAKLNPEFAAAVDAAWRLGGSQAAVDIISAELPTIAWQINQSVGSGH